MIHALSEIGLHALCEVASQPVLYAFDFDGTLAPISSDRQAVTVSAVIAQRLHELAKRAPCAVVSGRALQDIAHRIDGSVPHLIGNHGIEGPLTPRSVLVETERICTMWKQELQSMDSTMTSLGIEIEDKRYSLTLHFRGAHNPADAGRTALTWLRRLTPEPELMEGKYSINVLPRGQGGKGLAAFSLMNHLGRTGLFYIGDEETDETVFALPNALRMGVRVGWRDGSLAGYYLHEQAEVEELLRILIQCMDQGFPDPR